VVGRAVARGHADDDGSVDEEEVGEAARNAPTFGKAYDILQDAGMMGNSDGSSGSGRGDGRSANISSGGSSAGRNDDESFEECSSRDDESSNENDASYVGAGSGGNGGGAATLEEGRSSTLRATCTTHN